MFSILHSIRHLLNLLHYKFTKNNVFQRAQNCHKSWINDNTVYVQSANFTQAPKIVLNHRLPWLWHLACLFIHWKHTYCCSSSHPGVRCTVYIYNKVVHNLVIPDWSQMLHCVAYHHWVLQSGPEEIAVSFKLNTLNQKCLNVC